MKQPETRLPNLLLVGVQKSGTTWLHDILSASSHIFGSAQKELNFWGRANCADRMDDYRAHFPIDAKPDARFYLESTPHYFHAPNVFIDIAAQIRDGLPGVRPMVILRNPIDRYRSAYVHHIQKGRLDYSEVIDQFTDDQIMLSTGLYGKILTHWQTVFPDIIVCSYDSLRNDPAALITDVFDALSIPCDIDTTTLAQPIHTSAQKMKKSGWPAMPRLSDRLNDQLRDFYRDDIEHLQTLVDFDVRQWLAKST